MIFEIPDRWILKNIFPSDVHGSGVWILMFVPEVSYDEPSILTVVGLGENAQIAIEDALKTFNRMLETTLAPKQMDSWLATANRRKLESNSK